MNKRIALLLSLLLAHGVAVAAPHIKEHDDMKGPTNRSQHWDDKEYHWWQKNCLNDSTLSDHNRPTCTDIDGKYRDHYNRSGDPVRGHDKDDWHIGENEQYEGTGKYK